jgi:hypothetical protein
MNPPVLPELGTVAVAYRKDHARPEQCLSEREMLIGRPDHGFSGFLQ